MNNIVIRGDDCMWTICWIGAETGDGWDRFESKWDIINIANTLVIEGDVAPCDILIFPPEAEALAVSYDVLED